MEQLERAREEVLHGLVRVLDWAGKPVGGGLIVNATDSGDGWVVTCAHVVDAALGRVPEEAVPPGDARVQLDVWGLHGWVTCWGRPVSGGWWPLTERGGDVAVLELRELPAGVTPPRLHLPVRGEIRRFIACGFPPTSPDGILSYGLIEGVTADSEWTLVRFTDCPPPCLGHSGIPLVDVGLGAVVGIVVVWERAEPIARVVAWAAMIPLDKLVEYWPPLAAATYPQPVPASEALHVAVEVASYIGTAGLAG